MSIYSKRMAYTYASLGFLWLSPFIYWALGKYIPDFLYQWISEQEGLIAGLYLGLAGLIFLFGKAWAYWGQRGNLESERT